MKKFLFCLPAPLLLWAACVSQAGESARKVIILGIDGLDPKLLTQFAEEGILPHFSRLMEEGDFSPLQTTMPPLSPVAWSTFITGMDPGGHGIFDFLRRNPESLTPEFSMADVSEPEWELSLGSWAIPLESGKIEGLRKGRAFWEILEEKGIPTTIFRMPVNFPPAPAGRSLSGMGTPDLLGTSGTFTYFTDAPPANADDISGGRVYEVRVGANKVTARLEGPPNTFRRLREPGADPDDYTNPTMQIGFQVYLDPDEPVAKFEIQDQAFILREGEWSDWIRLEFEALPYLVNISGISRFYLKQVRPHFKLYVTPLQINPEEPVMPISRPEDWSARLQQELGYFYTQELAEDTKAFSAGIFDGHEFWRQSQMVYQEQRKALEAMLAEYREGLLFFYFSSVDQGCHMLWRYIDPGHPGYVADAELAKAVRQLYTEMDEALGRVLETADSETTVVVMSDHGFGPFYRGVNLNSWLADQGYVRLHDPRLRDGYPLFGNVDWESTRAYAVGLNGLYVNLRGREKFGIVAPGREYEELLDRLTEDLLAWRDPVTGQAPITSVVRTQRDFTGTHLEQAPDLIIGYGPTYRSSWENPLGEFPRQLLVDNLDPWSGDHSGDSDLVPGVLLSNRRITLESPALYDLTVAVLDEYGIDKLPEMLGTDCLQ